MNKNYLKPTIATITKIVQDRNFKTNLLRNQIVNFCTSKQLLKIQNQEKIKLEEILRQIQFIQKTISNLSDFIVNQLEQLRQIILPIHNKINSLQQLNQQMDDKIEKVNISLQKKICDQNEQQFLCLQGVRKAMTQNQKKKQKQFKQISTYLQNIQKESKHKKIMYNNQLLQLQQCIQKNIQIKTQSEVLPKLQQKLKKEFHKRIDYFQIKLTNIQHQILDKIQDKQKDWWIKVSRLIQTLQK